MQYIYGTTDIEQQESSVVILGNFDGVHIGHQKLFLTAQEKAKARGLKTIVFSFYPHPSWVIGGAPKALLMSRRDKEETIKKFGIDLLIEYPFTKAFASVSAQSFFEDILMNQLKAKVIIIGSNYYFGKGKEGNPEFLYALGLKHDCRVYIVDAVSSDGQIISSSSIRDLITQGDIEGANQILGHPYSIIGHVVQGRMLGRTIGFPTINLLTEPERIYPPEGVYATKIKVYNNTYLGMTNIGYNPTVNGTKKIIETHIFGFSDSLYDKEVEVEFYSAIRRERKFDSLAALAEQITKDKQQVQMFFKSLEK